MKTPLRTPAEKYQHRDISRQETIICADLGYFKNPEGVGISERNEQEHKKERIKRGYHRIHVRAHNEYMERKQASIKTSEKILAWLLVVSIFASLLWLCAIGMGELLKGTL